MTPSKKGFAMVFDTSGALGSVINTKAKMLEFGIQMAKMNAEQIRALQKQAFDVTSKNRTVDGRFQSDYDSVLNEEMSKLQSLAAGGQLTQSAISESSNVLNSMANMSNTAAQLYDQNNNKAKERGYIPERFKEMQDYWFGSMPTTGTAKVEAVMNMQNSGAFYATPLSSYMIDESVVANTFIESFGVSSQELRQGNYIAGTKTAAKLFSKKSDGTFEAKRDVYGLVDNEIFMKAQENPMLEREMADALYYEAFKRTTEEYGGAAVSWDEFRRLALQGQSDSSETVSNFYGEVIDAYQDLMSNPDEAYKIMNYRLGQLLDDTASGSSSMRTLPSGYQSLSHYYDNGQILFGTTNESAKVISIRTSVIKDNQFFSVPKEARKPVPAFYKGEQLNIIPTEWSVVSDSTGKRLAVKGNVAVKTPNEKSSMAFTQMVAYATQNSQSVIDVLDNSKNGLVPGIDPEVAAKLTIVMLPSDDYVLTDQTGAVIVGESIGYSRSDLSSGNAISILDTMMNKARRTIPGAAPVETEQEENWQASVTDFEIE